MSRHAKLKTAGLCTKCGLVPPVSNRAACSACLKRAREYHQRARDRWKSNGLCSQCGKRPPRPSRATCAVCAEYSLERGRETYLKRKQANLCTTCGKCPPVVGHALCLQCRKAQYKANQLREKKSNNYQAKARDNFTCQLCGSTRNILAHHIDGKGESKNSKRIPKHLTNNKLDNLITLCTRCHNALNHTIYQIVNVQLFFSLIRAQHPDIAN